MSNSRQRAVTSGLLLAALLWHISGVAETPESGEQAFDISISGTSIIYSGEISIAANQYFFALVEQAEQPLTTLVITSKGGDVDAGMDLGRWVFERQLDVRVTSFCGSSCANYVFPAARRKYVDETAMIAWHGGATQKDLDAVPACEDEGWFKEYFDCDAEAYRKQIAKAIEDLRAKEQEFFEDIGVDQRITVLGQNPEFGCGVDDSSNTGWYYAVEDLERLGVDHVEVLGDEWTPKPPSERVKVCKLSLPEPR
jgi:hypothetical protein